MRLAWPSHRQVTADFFTTLFTCNFCRPVTSLHVTTEICSCDSLVNGHCSQQVSWNQPLKRKIKLADHVPADGVKVGITCILPVRCFALSKVSAPGHAALLWTLPNRVSAVAREGSQESATSRQVWELEHIRSRHVAFAKVAWSSGELLLLLHQQNNSASKSQTNKSYFSCILFSQNKPVHAAVIKLPSTT